MGTCSIVYFKLSMIYILCKHSYSVITSTAFDQLFRRNHGCFASYLMEVRWLDHMLLLIQFSNRILLLTIVHVRHTYTRCNQLFHFCAFVIIFLYSLKKSLAYYNFGDFLIFIMLLQSCISFDFYTCFAFIFFYYFTVVFLFVHITCIFF
jgi:hypothetical protein